VSEGGRGRKYLEEFGFLHVGLRLFFLGPVEGRFHREHGHDGEDLI
jgi:hypothetical protein